MKELQQKCKYKPASPEVIHSNILLPKVLRKLTAAFAENSFSSLESTAALLSLHIYAPQYALRCNIAHVGYSGYNHSPGGSPVYQMTFTTTDLVPRTVTYEKPELQTLFF